MKSAALIFSLRTARLLAIPIALGVQIPATLGECGDGVVDVNEHCDDGNNFGGDGCAANCTNEIERVLALTITPQLPDLPVIPGRTYRVAVAQQRSGQGVGPEGGVLFEPGEVPLVLRADGPSVDPVAVPGLFCLCVRAVEMPDLYGPGNAGAGLAGCGAQGLSEVSYELVRDHNTGQSKADCIAGGGTIEGEDQPHPGVCNGPSVITFTQDGPTGSLVLKVATEMALLPDAGTCRVEPGMNGKGPDGIPCTSDDTTRGEVTDAPLTTGTVTVRALDANNVPGFRIEPGAMCGFDRLCHTQATGAPLDCEELLSPDPVADFQLAGGSVQFDTGNGDLVIAQRFAARISTSTPSCTGDCNSDSIVTVDELVLAVRIALGIEPSEACPAFGSNRMIQVDDLVSAVDSALGGCPRTPLPSPTPTSTPIACGVFIDCEPCTSNLSCLPQKSCVDGRCVTNTPTPTVTSRPTPDAETVTVATELLTEIQDRVCGTDITPGGFVDVAPTTYGAELNCGSFTGHNGYVRLSWFPSADDAVATFGEAGPDEELIELGGGLLRLRRQVPPCCPSIKHWSWVRDCWLVTGYSFDDTHFELAPGPFSTIEEIMGSPLSTDLFSQCPD
jgi:cysteine-rich repeat protein